MSGSDLTRARTGVLGSQATKGRCSRRTGGPASRAPTLGPAPQALAPRPGPGFVLGPARPSQSPNPDIAPGGARTPHSPARAAARKLGPRPIRPQRLCGRLGGGAQLGGAGNVDNTDRGGAGARRRQGGGLGPRGVPAGTQGLVSRGPQPLPTRSPPPPPKLTAGRRAQLGPRTPRYIPRRRRRPAAQRPRS